MHVAVIYSKGPQCRDVHGPGGEALRAFGDLLNGGDLVVRPAPILSLAKRISVR